MWLKHMPDAGKIGLDALGYAKVSGGSLQWHIYLSVNILKVNVL